MRLCEEMEELLEKGEEMEHQAQTIETRLTNCLTLDELHHAFTLQELFALANDGLLQEWMNAHLLESQAKMIDASVREQGRDALLLRLFEALSLDVLRLPDCDAALLTEAVERERKRVKRVRECGSDGVIVTNQGELVEALADFDVHKVYLYDEIFSIPLHRPKITYIGRGPAVIDILAQGDEVLDFDACGVRFYNLTLVVHYLEPHQVKMNDSAHNHIIFLHANRMTRDNTIPAHEVIDFLAGRGSFESPQRFAERAKRFRGVIVGTAHLSDADYDMEHGAFFLSPIWRVDFIDVVRRYVGEARLVFPVDESEASYLYEDERVQLVYADFGAEQDNALIVRLYLHTDGGHGNVYRLHRLTHTSSWAFGSGGGGYGLELIAADEEHRRRSG